MIPPVQNPSPFATFIELEGMAREVETIEALCATMVNGPRRLVPYRQAALVTADDAGSVRVEAVSGVAVIEADAPLVSWLARTAKQVFDGDHAARLHVVRPEGLAPAEGEAWAAWMPAEVLWCPLNPSSPRGPTNVFSVI